MLSQALALSPNCAEVGGDTSRVFPEATVENE